jgi:hypothetical protein
MKTKFTPKRLIPSTICWLAVVLAPSALEANSDQSKVGATYEDCRKLALKEFKQKKLSSAEAKQRLNQCNQRFPAANAINRCNEDAIRQNKGNATAMRAAVQKCKEFAKVVDFDARRGLPFALHRDEVWFAGSVLDDRTWTIDRLELPQFNCQAVKNAMAKPDTAQFILTGNQLKAFKGYATNGEALTSKVLRTKPKKDRVTGNNYWPIKDMGRIYQKDKKSRALLYFATAACTYTGELGERITSLEIHMLLDFKRKVATPVYALAFFSNKFNENSSTALSQLSHIIAATNRSFMEKRGLSILAQGKFYSDLEGDPQDLCLGDRSNQWMAIAKHAKPAPDQPLSYIVVANVKNLCNYGDFLSLGKKAPK